jgi:hypothetical protein
VVVVIVTVDPVSVAPVGEVAMLAPNILLIVGGPITVRLAFEVLPAPPSFEVTCTLLFLTPAVVPVTSTAKVHDEPTPGDVVRVPPDRLMLPLPAVAVIVPLPHEPVTFGVAATTRPAGKLSVKATPLCVTLVCGWLIVKLSVLLVFSAMLVGLNDLVMLAGEPTVRFAVPVLPVPPLVEVTWTLLFFTPVEVPVTFTVIVH